MNYYIITFHDEIEKDLVFDKLGFDNLQEALERAEKMLSLYAERCLSKNYSIMKYKDEEKNPVISVMGGKNIFRWAVIKTVNIFQKMIDNRRFFW